MSHQANRLQRVIDGLYDQSALKRTIPLGDAYSDQYNALVATGMDPATAQAYAATPTYGSTMNPSAGYVSGGQLYTPPVSEEDSSFWGDLASGLGTAASGIGGAVTSPQGQGLLGAGLSMLGLGPKPVQVQQPSTPGWVWPVVIGGGVVVAALLLTRGGSAAAPVAVKANAPRRRRVTTYRMKRR